jgi:capsular exopolysaccharide synthesis family protein
MSKVYEALKQREHERSDLSQNDPLAVVSAERPDLEERLDTELGLADEVLRAAFSPSEEDQKAGSLPGERFHSPSTSHATKYRVSPEDFRQLSLSYREDSRLTLQIDPHGLAAEQFRFLRRTLEQKFPNGGVLLITSPAPRDGKTLTALNLASYLAESGRPVLFVEGDIRQPSVQKAIGVSNGGAGVEEAMAGEIDARDAIQYVEQLSFYLAMVNTPPLDPSRVISGNGTKRFLSWARENFDWVIVDSPPVLAAADVAQLTTLVDAVLLVVRAQNTPRELTTRAFEMIGDRLSGVILNEAAIESNPYYRYLADHRQNRAEAARRERVPKSSAIGKSGNSNHQ